MTGDAEPGAPASGSPPALADRQQPHVLDLVREELTVDVQAVETGRVRINTRVLHEPVERRVSLSSTSARVERVDVDRIEESLPVPQHANGVTIIPLFEEVLVIRYRVTGEILVTEEVASAEQIIRDTLRRTVADVERLPPNEMTPS